RHQREERALARQTMHELCKCGRVGRADEVNMNIAIVLWIRGIKHVNSKRGAEMRAPDAGKDRMREALARRRFPFAAANALDKHAETRALFDDERFRRRIADAVAAFPAQRHMERGTVLGVIDVLA